MEYINGFAKNDFLQYMYQTFPSVYNNAHSRELLENTVDYCIEEEGENEGRLIDTLENLIPEISHNEVTRYFDNRPKEKVSISSLEELKVQIENLDWSIVKLMIMLLFLTQKNTFQCGLKHEMLTITEWVCLHLVNLSKMLMLFKKCWTSLLTFAITLN